MIKKIIFLLFFLSGFCGLLYQTVWLRLAFASFGINAQVISIVVSVFMLGLVLGSWLSGSVFLKLARKYRIESIYLYSIAEAGIGVGALVVPRLFMFGRDWLLSTGQTNSIPYLGLSALVLSISILPWCFLMGTTIPLIVDFLNARVFKDKNVFSYLYLANTFGAMIGTVVTALVFVELFGFARTLIIASAVNFVIALAAWMIGRKLKSGNYHEIYHPILPYNRWELKKGEPYIYGLLFATGFVSLGLEVVWNRLFTSVLFTSVYAFAFIIFLYLLGTILGLVHYRIDLRRGKILPTAFLLLLLSALCIGQIWINDPRPKLGVTGIIITVVGIAYILGYLTPKQIDGLSLGRPQVVGIAYAVNLAGCILGPIAASYIFLPLIGSKFTIILLAFFLTLFLVHKETENSPLNFDRDQIMVVVSFFLLVTLFFGSTYEELNYKDKVIKHDYNATVLAVSGNEPRDKGLLVNGVGMTALTPITKIMAHLPLALEPTRPQKVLVICMGMGTTFRSALTWDVDTTVVELTPSVASVFSYFHADAPAVLANPKAHVVIDDGRRYLQRSTDKYDLIVIDPPPPVQAAGSSLLYSKQFYQIAIQHLTPNGILAQWIPGLANSSAYAAARSLTDVFPYVMTYGSVEEFGFHFFASANPIRTITPEQFVSAMPKAAQTDLMEWNDYHDPSIAAYAKRILDTKMETKDLLKLDPAIAITDDEPYNEYYFLRQNFR
jgi:spermidine synthase